ncbi:uncharacterized [Tachysurus ichikawai]
MGEKDRFNVDRATSKWSDGQRRGSGLRGDVTHCHTPEKRIDWAKNSVGGKNVGSQLNGRQKRSTEQHSTHHSSCWRGVT